jgi:predicted membrane channel-forming protein YqfA (hemolysin III family)
MKWIRKFILSQDPAIWHSLIIASVLTIAFTIFVMYDKPKFNWQDYTVFIILASAFVFSIYATVVSKTRKKKKKKE